MHLVQNESQNIELNDSYIYAGLDLDEDIIDSHENLEPLLESLGYRLSNDMIDFDETAGLDEGLDFQEEIDIGDNLGSDGMDVDQDFGLSQILSDFSDSEPCLDTDNLGGGQVDEASYALGAESISGTYLSKSDTKMLKPTV